MRARILFLLLFAGTAYQAQSQVLLSLIFGEKLNSPNIEFGLEGGWNFSTVSNFESKAALSKLNLGFYFDFRIKNNWYFNTGTVVKGTLGIDKLKENDIAVLRPDAAFRDEGDYSLNLGYFQVPLTIKYRFKDHYNVQLGPQLGLLHTAFLQFDEKNGDSEIRTTTDIRDDFYRIDAGILIGAGYRLSKGIGLTFSAKYYYGLTNILKNTANNYKNRTLYIMISLPIGRGKVKDDTDTE